MYEIYKINFFFKYNYVQPYILINCIKNYVDNSYLKYS